MHRRRERIVDEPEVVALLLVLALVPEGDFGYLQVAFADIAYRQCQLSSATALHLTEVRGAGDGEPAGGRVARYRNGAATGRVVTDNSYRGGLETEACRMKTDRHLQSIS